MKLIKRIKRLVPIWVLIVIGLVLALILLTLLSRSYRPLADFINTYAATPIRALTSALTFLLPFSLFELILLLLLPSVVLLIVLVVRDKAAWDVKFRRIFAALGVIGILYSGYLTVMAIPYNTTPLADRLGISEDENIEREELYLATVTVRDRVNELSARIPRYGAESEMPYTPNEASRLISLAYEAVREEHPFFYNFESRAKRVFFSDLMSDMGIGGIYTYFTGEANVNTSYPDYCYVFTVAHEFAHQRGINRENEANFMAFFVLSRSGDTYLEYSAYLNLYEYLASALYSLDKELYREVNAVLAPEARADSAAASAVTRKHRDSPLYKLMNRVNDAYLKSNGTDGVVSYGYVVRLAVGYIQENGIPPTEG